MVAASLAAGQEVGGAVVGGREVGRIEPQRGPHRREIGASLDQTGVAQASRGQSGLPLGTDGHRHCVVHGPRHGDAVCKREAIP
jgi:hypothetical protein